eukprot:5907841-Pleurochrysis_carterae.AAC.1
MAERVTDFGGTALVYVEHPAQISVRKRQFSRPKRRWLCLGSEEGNFASQKGAKPLRVSQ